MGYDITIDPLTGCNTKSMDYLNRIIQATKIYETYLLYCSEDIDSIYFICPNVPTQNIIIHPKVFFVTQTFFNRTTQTSSITISFDGAAKGSISGTNLFKRICADEFDDLTDESKRQYLLNIA